MSGPGRRFDPSELDDLDGAPLTDVEAAAMLAIARDLEGFAQATTVTPTPGFEDRVMTAVAAEAPPRPVATGGRIAGLVVAFRDAWRITWSGDRPMAVRAQAFALVLLVLVAVGSTTTLAAVGVSQLLRDDDTPPTVQPSVAPPSPDDLGPTAAPSRLQEPSTSPSPSIDGSDDPGDSAEPSEDLETPDATEDGDGSGKTAEPSRTPRPTAKPTHTPEATDTPEPTDTQEPEETEHPDDTPEPDDTPHPTQTLKAGETPKPSETPHSGGDGSDDSAG
jgi:hypothetical protein